MDLFAAFVKKVTNHMTDFKIFREKSGVSLISLAYMGNIHPSTLSRIECGWQQPTDLQCTRIIESFVHHDVDVEGLSEEDIKRMCKKVKELT